MSTRVTHSVYAQRYNVFIVELSINDDHKEYYRNAIRRVNYMVKSR